MFSVSIYAKLLENVPDDPLSKIGVRLQFNLRTF